MMKRLVLPLALVWGATPALAQAPAAPATPIAVEVPAAKCDPKPVYPGPKVMQDDAKREKFQKEIKAYQDCVKAFVAERKAYVEATNAAIRTTVEEHNAIMNKIRADQDAAKGEQK
jgi:hypothetical protein